MKGKVKNYLKNMKKILKKEPLMKIFGRLKTSILYNKDLERAGELVKVLEEKLKFAKIEESYFSSYKLKI